MQLRLTDVTNSQAVPHKKWTTRCSTSIWGFSQSNLNDFELDKSALEERDSLEWIKTPVLTQAVLETELMEKLQSNLKEKDNPNIVKDDSASRKVSSIINITTHSY